MVQKELSIGEACTQFDVTARALRFYEDKGLIAPRRVGLRRLYGAEETRRLKLILRAKRFGFTLLQIQDLLEMSFADRCAVEKKQFFAEMARDQLSKLEDEHKRIKSAIEELSAELRDAEQETALAS